MLVSKKEIEVRYAETDQMGDGLKKEWIHQDKHYPHFDLMGDVQIKVLTAHNLTDQIERFRLQ